MNTKEIAEKKSKLKLTDRQRDIIVGLLLGDGHLETQNGGETYRLKVEHSIAQRDYVEWLYKELSEWIPAEKPFRKKRINDATSVGFATYSHASLRFYGHQFYPSGKKVVPRVIRKLLRPIGLAVWFMDDGSKKSNRHKTYIIHTLGYTKGDLERLSETIKDVFGIHTTLHRQKNKYYRLYVLSQDARKFEDIVRPTVERISSMKHKLSNKNA